MAELVIFISTALLAYWIARVWTLLSRTDKEINRVLESDLCLAHKLLAGLRTMFFPPTQLVG